MDEYQNPCNATGALSRDSSGISPNMSMIFFFSLGFWGGGGEVNVFYLSTEFSLWSSENGEILSSVLFVTE